MSTTRPEAKQHAQPKRKLPILVIVFVGVLALLLTALFLGGGDGPADPAAEYGSPQITGDPLPRYPVVLDEIQKRIVHANCQQRRQLRVVQPGLARVHEMLDGLLEVSVLGESRRLEGPESA